MTGIFVFIAQEENRPLFNPHHLGYMIPNTPNTGFSHFSVGTIFSDPRAYENYFHKTKTETLLFSISGELSVTMSAEVSVGRPRKPDNEKISAAERKRLSRSNQKVRERERQKACDKESARKATQKRVKQKLGRNGRKGRKPSEETILNRKDM